MPEITLPGTTGEISHAAWAAYRNNEITGIWDDHGCIAKIVPADQAKVARVLSFNEAMVLGDIIRACQSHSKLRYYPRGADVPAGKDDPVVQTAVMRAITHDGGGFARDDEDIRDLFVWTSGIFEHWHRVSALVNALSNMDGHLGLSEPMATIDWNNS